MLDSAAQRSTALWKDTVPPSTLCYAMMYIAYMPVHAWLHHALLCYKIAMVSHAVLRLAALCHAIPCCHMPYIAMLSAI